MSGQTPEKWASDEEAIAAFGAHHGYGDAPTAAVEWMRLAPEERVNWRAAVDAMRMLAAIKGPPPAPAPAAAMAEHAELEDAYAAAHGRVAELEGELDALRGLLDEIGVMAANAPEDGDSFGLLEQIAWRIAAVDVPDSTPLDEWPDPENPITGRTPGAAATVDITGGVLTAAVQGKRILLQLGGGNVPQPAPELAIAQDASDLEVAAVIAERNQLRIALQRLADDGNLEARDRLAGIFPELTGVVTQPAPEAAAEIRRLRAVLGALAGPEPMADAFRIGVAKRALEGVPTTAENGQ